MNAYYNIHNWEVREIADEIHAEWVATGNPKADVWLPLPAPPAHDSTSQHPPEWHSGGWHIREKTEEEVAAAARKIWPDAAYFWGEFSELETEGIVTSTHPLVKRLAATLYTWRSTVFSDDPRVVMGLTLLEAVGILTPERKTQILTP